MTGRSGNHAPASAGGPGPDKRWRVIFIGDQGRVVTFRHLRAILALAAAAFLVVLAAAALLALLNRRLDQRELELRRKLEIAERQARELRQEKDRLAVELFLMDAKMREAFAGMGRPVFAGRPETAAPAASAAAQPAGREGAAGEGAFPALPAGPGATGAAGGIAARDLTVRLKSRPRTVEARVTLAAVSPGGGPLAGHAVVVLKNDELPVEKWLALPQVPLSGGRPTGRSRGAAFEFRRSKNLVLSAAAGKPLPELTAAVLYVFDRDGRVLCEKEFAVRIASEEG